MLVASLQYHLVFFSSTTDIHMHVPRNTSISSAGCTGAESPLSVQNKNCSHLQQVKQGTSGRVKWNTVRVSTAPKYFVVVQCTLWTWLFEDLESISPSSRYFFSCFVLKDGQLFHLWLLPHFLSLHWPLLNCHHWVGYLRKEKHNSSSYGYITDSKKLNKIKKKVSNVCHW